MAEILSNTRPYLPRRNVRTATFKRPTVGPIWVGEVDGLVSSRTPGLQLNGGASKHDEARSLPISCEFQIEPDSGQLRRISVIGVFALNAGLEAEMTGTTGAVIQAFSDKGLVFKRELVYGVGYTDARNLEPMKLTDGAGLSLESVGVVEIDGALARVDLLTIDIPELSGIETIRFKDQGTSASFILFDVFLESQTAEGCPFREHNGNVSLAELSSVVRLADRVRFQKAMRQLDDSIEKAEDLDEARGQVLTFLAVVTAATLEMGAPRSMVRVGLTAARQLDTLTGYNQVREAAHDILRTIADPLFVNEEGPSNRLMDRALGIVDRHFSKNLSDATLADALGLSTSHFRFLFRQATGQPFHRYLLNVRLEKAKQLLVEGEMGVTQISSAVGFSGLSHFSRAFTARFKASPSAFRRPARSRSA